MKNKSRKILNKDDTPIMILTIPEDLQKIESDNEISRIIHEFGKAETVEQQITIIHSLSTFLNTPVGNENNLVLRILTNLFVTAKPKHPVKKSILRTFSNAKNLNDQISTHIAFELIKIVQVESHDYNDAVNSINDCFNNFPDGVKAINTILEQLFPFLIKILNFYLKELSGTTSPIALQELYKYIHNITRALVSVSQQCDINEFMKKYIDHIFKSCVTILNNPDILYDTKNNCGIILIIASNIEFENGYSTLLNIFDNKNDIAKWGISPKDFQDDITVTCVYSGILNIIQPEQLCKFSDSFKQSDIYKMTEKLLEISKNSADKPTTVLGVSRSIYLVSRALGPLNDENLIGILPSLLDHVWTQLDHNIDTIRQVSKSIFVNLVKLASLRKNTDPKKCPLNIIIDSVFHFSPLRPGRYVALSIIGSEFGCEILLSKDPNLTKDFLKLAEESSIASYVTSCYENLMRCHFKETDEESWFNQWVFPLTSNLEQEEELDEKGTCYQKLLIKVIKFKPFILSSIFDQWSFYNELQFSSLLKCALIARKIGVDLNEKDKWRGLLDQFVLEFAMTAQNDEIRISSLSLIAESHKSTEIFNKFELKFIVSFLKYNINTQFPGTRQRILFLMKKILTRFSESYPAVYRNFTQIKEKLGPDEQEELYSQKYPQYKIFLEQHKHYCDFILYLNNCIFDSLFPGANFSRRIICLEVLTFLDPIKTQVFKDPICWKQSEVDALLRCLSDSYETNKQLAANLLKKCPVDLLKLHTVEKTSKFIENALRNARSVKPADTMTAAYMFETSMYSPVINDVLTEFLHPTQNYSPEYLIINLLLNNLKQQIEIGQNSLLKAASSSPMHGTLFCIRHLMEKYLFTSNLNEDYWKNLLGEIIETCFEVSEIVCPVVNSSSPEGHLPMDHEAVDNTNEEVVTAQMLLVCSWRSIKEVSLLLGEITLRATIIGENSSGFITEEQMIKIGEHFTVLLTETKHRGAFEQAYVGFTKLCNRLWRCRTGTLHQLPITWLRDIISAVSGDNSAHNNKLCATRRSAGVPFMIQAIVVSELQTGGNSHFHECMLTLLQFANHTDNNIERRTHAMNILRALYRHTQLGEDISPYIAEGVIAAISGFSRKTWAERNSATLLFSSLMTRIFGVQRTRDTEKLNIRNKMTGRVFFLRYPSLYPFLLDLLKELTQENCEYYKEVALYPILLLLARLYPATCEENDSNKQLQDFIPYVRICSKNKSLKTRELAARALVPLVPSQQRPNLVKELIGLLQNRSEHKNYIHGILLQMFYLLPTLPANFFEQDDLKRDLQKTIWLLTCNDSNCCPIIAALYMQIVSTICVRETNSRCVVRQNIFSVVSSQDKYIQNNCVIGKQLYYREAINSQLKVLIEESDWKVCPFLIKHLQHENKDVKEFILNFLICLLKNSNTTVHIDSLELPEHEEKLINLISPKFKNGLFNNIKHYIKKFTIILKIIMARNSNLLSKALFVLCNLLQMNELSIKDQIDYFSLLDTHSENPEIMSAMLTCFPFILRNAIEKNLTKDTEAILKIISEASKSDFSCRYYAAVTLLEMKSTFYSPKSEINFESLLCMTKTIMALLTDSEPIVRNTISNLSRKNRIAEYVSEDIFSHCVTQLSLASSKEKCTSLLLYWAFTGSDSEETDEDIELQIFERGEVSTYVEEMCFSNLSAKILNYSEIADVTTTKIVAILEDHKDVWEANETDRINLITIFREIELELKNCGTCKHYFKSENNTWFHLNTFYKYKVLNILKNWFPVKKYVKSI